MNTFSETIFLVKESIQTLVGFVNLLLPILITLMMATGSIASSGIVQPILMLLINFIGNIISNFIIPIVLISTVLNIISKVSDEIKISKLSKFLNSSTIWVLGIILTLFVTVLSLEGNITSTVDGVTAKTTKAAVSTIIPVVGKILGDATDAVIGAAGILKNAVGFIGIIVILSICLSPILKLTILIITYYLSSAICEPIADAKIVSLLSRYCRYFQSFISNCIFNNCNTNNWADNSY